MRILVACEESQRVCKEFRKKGHEVYSCDLLPCGGGSSGMAFANRCDGTFKNEMGHGSRVPALHTFSS